MIYMGCILVMFIGGLCGAYCDAKSRDAWSIAGTPSRRAWETATIYFTGLGCGGLLAAILMAIIQILHG